MAREKLHALLAERPLRLRLMALAGLLLLFAWANSAVDMWNLANTWQEAAISVEVNHQVDALLKAGIDLAWERGRTNVLLQAPGIASDSDRDFLARHRESTARSLAFLGEPGNFPRMDSAARFMGAHDRLVTLRKEVDAALCLPREQRPADLRGRWFALATEVVEDTGELASDLFLANQRHSITFRGFSRMKVLAFELRNKEGLAATRIAALVSSESKLSPTETEAIYRFWGQGQVLQNQLRKESRFLENPGIAEALARVESLCFHTLHPLQERILDHLETSGTSPVSLEELLAAGQTGLEPVADLLDVLSAETERDVRGQLDSSRLTFLGSALRSLVALVVGILLVRTLAFRLFIPLQEIGGQLQRLARGDVETPIPPVGRNDELTRSHEAVEAFRNSLVERMALEEQLRRMGETDGLTGLANRRCLDRRLEDEWLRALRSGQSLSVVMLDVDHFKLFNDRFGHMAGDEALRGVARVLTDHVRRPGDLAARYGGEEFLVILPGLDALQASDWAEQVRRAVEAGENVLPDRIVTISAGVASAGIPECPDLRSLRDVADRRLYLAKARGRNRVVGPGEEKSG